MKKVDTKKLKELVSKAVEIGKKKIQEFKEKNK